MAEPAKTNFTSRTEFFANRLDRYLPTLQSDQARLVFLNKQREVFRRQYGEFIASGGETAKPDPVFGWPTAFDFAETLADLDLRIQSISGQQREAA